LAPLRRDPDPALVGDRHGDPGLAMVGQRAEQVDARAE
jgi:hypothetical protein